jgi:hypothetical protein
VRTVFAIVGVLLALSVPARAAGEISVRAYVDPAGTVTDTDRLSLVIEAEAGELPHVSVRKLPTLKNLKILTGPSSRGATTFRSSGGRSEQIQSKSLIFTLLPEGPGPAEVPAIIVQVGDETFTTEPIRFEVVEGTRGSPPATGSPSAEIPPVFLEAKLSSEEIWEGEPVTLDVTLVSATRVGNFSWLERPAFTNFWVEEIEVDPQGGAYPTHIGGRRYSAYPLVRKILVPNTAGRFTLDPFSAQFSVRRSSRDRFGDFFSMDRFQSVIRKTDPLVINVKPLPDPAPDGFGGAVGTFKLKVGTDREEAGVDDAVALTATIEGVGFLGATKPPALATGSDLRIFEPKVSQTARYDRGRYIVRKTWEWVVVPRTPGELPMPEVRFAYFDTDDGVYRELSKSPPDLVVRRGDLEPDERVARGAVRLQHREIAFIKRLRGGLKDDWPRLHERGWFIALLVLPIVVMPAVVLVSRRRARYSSNRGLARARKARARARKNLRSTERRMGQLDTGAFHEAVARSLVDYVADRFDRSASGMTYDLADQLLASREVDEDLRQRFRGCLESCDFARFVPASDAVERRNEVLQEAIDLVDRLERALA